MNRAAPVDTSLVADRLPPRPVMLRALARRDGSFEGIFLVGVTTTGIFCRPGCPARQPRSDHVRFFATTREALFAGFRPCRRCRPLAPKDAVPEWLAPVLALVERTPARRLRDAELRTLGVEPARVRRWFVRQHGMTFQAYARSRRLTAAFRELQDGRKLDHVALDHDFESLSGFRSAFERWFGRPPGRARGKPGGDDLDDFIVIAWIESPLGPLVAGAVREGVCLLEFSDRRMLETQLATLRRRIGRPALPGSHPHLDQLRRELAEWFAGRRRDFSVPLFTPGSAFEQRVWAQLRQVPSGTTRSYRDIAVALGSPTAARAVGRANGCNRVAIVIPCHRVVNKDGRLGGYGGGVWRKQWLLRHEREALPAGR